MERKKGKQQRKEKKLSFFNLIEQRILYFERLDKSKRLSKYIFYSSFSLLTFATKK